jgi:hypothetical protein
LKQLQVRRRGSQPEDDGGAHAFSIRAYPVQKFGARRSGWFS